MGRSLNRNNYQRFHRTTSSSHYFQQLTLSLDFITVFRTEV